MTNSTGQCLCGSITYSINKPAIRSTVCHCLSCQKSSGSAYSINICIPAEAFNISGYTLKRYTSIGGSGKSLHRYFCQTCGSPIYTKPDALSGLIIVKAGTLDEPHSFKPEANIWSKSKMEWLKHDQQMLDFEKMPPS